MWLTRDIVIDRPRDTVVRLFDYPDNLNEWRDGFVRFTPLEGAVGQEGSTAEFVFRMGGLPVVMLETILERDLPDRFAASYVSGPITVLVTNRFFCLGAATEWQVESRYHIQGVMRLVFRLFPWLLARENDRILKAFKAFVERSTAPPAGPVSAA